MSDRGRRDKKKTEDTLSASVEHQNGFLQKCHRTVNRVFDALKSFVSGFGGKGEKSDSEVLDLSERIKIHKSKTRIRMILIGTAAVVLIVSYAIFHQVRVYHHYRIISSVERSDDNETVYVSLGKYRLKCNPNGVTCIDRKNNVQWNTTFSMQSPLVDVCDSVVAVADLRGSEVYVFSQNGLISNFSVEHVLTKLKITKTGDVAVVLEDGQVTWIDVYNKEGELLIKNKTTMAESGYPVDFDISENGLKMVVSYLGINDDIESRVVFYNFSSVGQEANGKVVNEESYAGSVIPEVKFMSGSYAIAFRDDGITIFRGQQIPEQCNNVEVDQEINSVFSDDQYFGIITLIDEPEAKHKYRMIIYRENGTKCGTTEFDFDYSDIVMDHGRVVLYNDTSMQIYDTSGKLKYDADYRKKIVRVIPESSSKKYTVLTEDSIDLMKIR